MFVNLSATVFRSFLPYVPLQVFPEIPKIGLTNFTLAIAGVAGATAALAWIYKTWQKRTPVQLLVSFLAVALIVASVPTLAFGRPSIIDSESERYVYFPSVFASMLVGLVVTVLVKARAVRIGASIAVVLFFGAFLELSNRNWATAGELTASILSSVGAQDGPGDLALVVPDSLNGAFIFRNGLPAALALFGPQPGPRIGVVGTMFLKRPDEAIGLSRTGDMGYTVSVASGRATLLPAVEPVLTGVRAAAVDPSRLDMFVERPIRFGYYSVGQMRFDDLSTSSNPVNEQGNLLALCQV